MVSSAASAGQATTTVLVMTAAPFFVTMPAASLTSSAPFSLTFGSTSGVLQPLFSAPFPMSSSTLDASVWVQPVFDWSSLVTNSRPTGQSSETWTVPPSSSSRISFGGTTFYGSQGLTPSPTVQPIGRPAAAHTGSLEAIAQAMGFGVAWPDGHSRWSNALSISALRSCPRLLLLLLNPRLLQLLDMNHEAEIKLIGDVDDVVNMAEGPEAEEEATASTRRRTWAPGTASCPATISRGRDSSRRKILSAAGLSSNFSFSWTSRFS
ncbi:unnamed protein product, partial [Cuscuta epithymum]